jgi:hypothetical protein
MDSAPAGARALANFWRRISHVPAFGLLQPTCLDRMMGNRSLNNSPAHVMLDMMTRLLSPCQFNPMSYDRINTGGVLGSSTTPTSNVGTAW